MSRMKISFIVKKKGGPAGGRLLSAEVPSFDWIQFKNTPNAEQFVKKAYISAVKKIILETEVNQNRTNNFDLSSVESVITRSLSFTKSEIKEWIESRDWTGREYAKSIIEKNVSSLASRINPFTDNDAEKLAYTIAAVCDGSNPVHDFLFSILTKPRPYISPDDL